MNWLMRVSVVTFIISLGAWALIAVWTIVDVNELLLTWQRIAVVLAVVSGLALLVIEPGIGSDVEPHPLDPLLLHRLRMRRRTLMA